MSPAMVGLSASGSSSGHQVLHDSRPRPNWSDLIWWQSLFGNLGRHLSKPKKTIRGRPGVDYSLNVGVYLVEELAIVIPRGGVPGLCYADVRPLTVVPATAECLQQAIPRAFVRSAEAIGVELEWGSQVWDDVWEHLPVKSYEEISQTAELVHVWDYQGKYGIRKLRGVSADGFVFNQSELGVPEVRRAQLGESVLAALRELRAERPRNIEATGRKITSSSVQRTARLFIYLRKDQVIVAPQGGGSGFYWRVKEPIFVVAAEPTAVSAAIEQASAISAQSVGEDLPQSYEPFQTVCSALGVKSYRELIKGATCTVLVESPSDRQLWRYCPYRADFDTCRKPPVDLHDPATLGETVLEVLRSLPAHK